MKIIEIFGLSRSGHHAMTNWVIKNLCGDECAMEWKLNIMRNGLFYINEGNLDEELTLKYIEEQKDKIRVLIISYENCFTDYSILNSDKKYDSPLSLNIDSIKNYSKNYRVVFIRDFYDNLSSRIKSNEKNLSKTREGIIQPWNITEGFVEKWKNTAESYSSNNFLSLKFEDWLNKKEVRDSFIEKILGHGEIYDNKVKGTHSSFGDKQVIDRFSRIELNNEVKKIIKKDNKLHYLMGSLGYGYKEI